VGALLHESAPDGEGCIGTYYHHPMPALVPLDLGDGPAVRKMILDLRPVVCYLPAALTFVDYAETHADQCRQANVAGVSEVARAIAEVDGLLVFFSTDHVFSDSVRPWKEDDPPSPQNIYARSKAEAEQIVRDVLPDRHLILRTSWVFGPDPQEKNFAFRVRGTLEKGERLVVPTDQHGQPTFGPDLGRTARQLVSLGARGTYHVVGPQYLSRLQWARLIATTLHLPVDLIEGVPSSSLELAAPRPLHSRLARSKLISFLGHDPIRPPQHGIAEMMVKDQVFSS
jgi:dTDP-4-dehydrorhamnose reductase